MKKLFSVFYDIALHFFVLLSLPKMVWRLIGEGKYRSNFFQRLGIGFPLIEKGSKPIIWIHAVSLGETKAIAPLVQELKKHCRVILSTTTETGYAEGKKCNPDYHVYLPFDFRYIIRPIVKRISPKCLLLVETDFWFHFQDAAKEAGASLILVNGKISERSMKRFSFFSLFSKHLLHPIDLFCLQGSLYAERFRKLGIFEKRIVVTGNLKLDGIVIQKIASLKKDLHANPDDLILTLGSTHEPEEKVWISHLNNLWKTYPQLKVMIVPRHPERFEKVAALLNREGIDFERWSKGRSLKKNVLLVDTMGVLANCYQISTVAFVGGSLTAKIGGHNILEPAFYGVPVLYGPHMHSQPDLLDLMKAYQAGIGVTQESIPSTLKRLLNSAIERKALGENGLRLIEESKGALDATFQAIFPYLGCNK